MFLKETWNYNVLLELSILESNSVSHNKVVNSPGKGGQVQFLKEIILSTKLQPDI